MLDWRDFELRAGQRVERKDPIDEVLKLMRSETAYNFRREKGADPFALPELEPKRGNKQMDAPDYSNAILKMLAQNAGKESLGVHVYDSTQYQNEVSTDEFDLS